MGKPINRNLRIVILMLLDYAIVFVSYWLSFKLSFEFAVPSDYWGLFWSTTYIWPFIYIAFYVLFKIYRFLWKYISIDEIFNLAVATILSALTCFVLGILLGLPKRTPVIAATIILLVVCGVRLAYRWMLRMKAKYSIRTNPDNNMNIMIIGAGDAGDALIKEITSSPSSRYNIMAIIDDDAGKVGNRLHGVPIVGNTSQIRHYAERLKIDEIIVAIPSASYQQLSLILENCPRARCRLRIMPKIFDASSGGSALNEIREINIEDLLIRDEVKLDYSSIRAYIQDKVVMVTGGGGSIGGELCNQIMKFSPKKLIIFDINENNAYELMYELNMKYKRTDAVKVCIGSVQDRRRLTQLMKKYRPAVVFHAAAYKHVPLMEESPDLAVLNNVLGTYNTATLALEHHVEKFVLISTDKAVNPTNVMGATKRIAELIVQSLNDCGNTDFVSVRFGNVLGSNGSVVPLFKKQIEMGGPITITDENITRYFMTISEAASLVMEAGAIAKGGETFILDMGEPIKILDLAKNMIRLSGLVPYQDIDIKFIGLRKGEKLYEELVLSEEDATKSENIKLFIAHPPKVSFDTVSGYISRLDECILTEGDVKECLKEILPNYKPAAALD